MSDPVSPDPLMPQAKELERERCAAFVSADLARIERWLDRELRYTHSNGVVDSKESLLELLGSGKVRYEDIRPDVRHVAGIGSEGLVISGILETHVVLDGAHSKRLLGCYTAVWRREVGGSWRLVALQGSNVTDPTYRQN